MMIQRFVERSRSSRTSNSTSTRLASNCSRLEERHGDTTMMRQDRFTEGAQEVLAASQELVRKERHTQWDVEHVLLALLQYGKGITPEIFTKLGVDTGKLRDAVSKALDGSPKLAYDVVQIYTTPRIVKMLEAAN